MFIFLLMVARVFSLSIVFVQATCAVTWFISLSSGKTTTVALPLSYMYVKPLQWIIKCFHENPHGYVIFCSILVIHESLDSTYVVLFKSVLKHIGHIEFFFLLKSTA